MTRPLCCFHRSDLDGTCSAAIVLKALSGNVDLLGYNYGDDTTELLKEAAGRPVIMVDCSLPFEDMKTLQLRASELIWIDHHIGAIKDAAKARFDPPGLRRDGTAGCELTWEYYFPKDPMPAAVYLLGRHDVWDLNASPNVEPFQYGMRARDTQPEAVIWDFLLQSMSAATKTDQRIFNDLIKEGRIIHKYQKIQDAQIVKSCSFETDLAGFKAIAANAGKGSGFFDAVYDPEKHDLMMPFHRLPYPKQLWTVSLYSTKDHIDCSTIAKAFGGGGHKLASGFTCKELPFKY